MYILENSKVEISFNDNGALLTLKNKLTNTEYLSAPKREVWKLILGENSGTVNTIVSLNQQCRIAQHGNRLECEYESLRVKERKVEIYLRYTVELNEDEILWQAELRNSQCRQIQEFQFPIISGVGALNCGSKDRQNNLYWPAGCGIRIPNPEISSKQRKIRYPGASMQWFEYGNQREGLYMASLDQSLATTSLEAQTSEQTLSFRFTKYPFLQRGETWKSQKYVVSPHSGDWHIGAKKYRKWADTWMVKPEPPKWIKECNGWFLVILKQQNGDIMWKYVQIPQILEIARKSGLEMLGLFGWAIGGHDHLYPDYSPDPNMGTFEDIKKSLEKVGSTSGRCILYVNGQLMDTSGKYYAETGRSIAAKKADGKPYTEHWKKYSDHPGYVHAVACPSTHQWQEKLLELGKYVQGLGADGIIYDQIGGRGSRLCFDESHPHKKPSNAMGPGILKNFKAIRDTVKEVNPDFAIITEHPSDSLCQYVDFIHGSGQGFRYSPSSFPELFRYTFPEYIMTNRNPSPYMNYTEANFAFLHGFRFDIESRYAPDVTLLQEGKRPDDADYANITGKPDVQMLKSEPIEDYAAYLKELCEIRKNHPVLLYGTFLDDQKFVIDNKKLEAKAFMGNGEVAIVVWNFSGEPQPFEISVPGYKLVETIKTGTKNTDISAPIEHNRLAILFFEKRN